MFVIRARKNDTIPEHEQQKTLQPSELEISMPEPWPIVFMGTPEAAALSGTALKR